MLLTEVTHCFLNIVCCYISSMSGFIFIWSFLCIISIVGAIVFSLVFLFIILGIEYTIRKIFIEFYVRIARIPFNFGISLMCNYLCVCVFVHVQYLYIIYNFKVKKDIHIPKEGFEKVYLFNIFYT